MVDPLWHNPTIIEEKLAALEEAQRESVITSSGALVYDSWNGQGVNLNGQGRSDDQTVIECRQLSAFVAQHNIKDSHHALSSTKRIERAPYLKNDTYQQQRPKVLASHYVFSPLNTIGQAFADLSDSLDIGEKTSLLFDSDVHAMAVSIQRKTDDNGAPYVVIKFYDPNRTDAHLRIVCPTRKSIEGLQIADFIKAFAIRHYFQAFQSACLYTNTKCSDTEKPKVTIYPGVEDSALLHHSCYADLDKTVTEVSKQILRTSGESGCSALALDKLQAYSTEGTPALGFAMQVGSARAITAFVQQILQSNLSNAEKVSLLSAKRLDGTSGIYFAFQYNYHKVISTYLDLILQSDLPEEDKVSVLTAKGANGAPAPYPALYKGHGEAINAYVSRVVQSTLSDENKLRLLDTRLPNGESGLYLSYLRGKWRSCQAYTRPILSSDLKCTDKFWLTKDSENELLLPFRLVNYRWIQTRIRDMLPEPQATFARFFKTEQQTVPKMFEEMCERLPFDPNCLH